MAFSAALGNAGFVPQKIATTAAVTLEPVDGANTVTKSHLTMSARIPGIDQATFESIADGAKAKCPISRLLNCEITLDATLEG
jgi:osmotically inducible protein OsmC